MGNMYNTAKLAEQVAERLGLDTKARDDLYEELSKTKNGPIKDALAALSGMGTSTYVACIKASCVRDAQHSRTYDADLMDDDAWVDASELPLFLEVVCADTMPRAVQIAASRAGVDEDVIELHPM